MQTFILPPTPNSVSSLVLSRQWLQSIVPILPANKGIHIPSNPLHLHFSLHWEVIGGCLFESDSLHDAQADHPLEQTVNCVEKATPPVQGCLLTIEKAPDASMIVQQIAYRMNMPNDQTDWHWLEMIALSCNAHGFGVLLATSELS